MQVVRSMVNRPFRLADSVIGAMANVVLACLALWLANRPQEALPSWVWAVSILYAITIAPLVMLFVNMVLASRDYGRGMRVQAIVAVVVAIITSALVVSRIAMKL